MGGKVARTARRLMSVGLFWIAALVLFALPQAAQAAGSVYVANNADNSVSQYAIGVGSDLSPLSPSTANAGSAPEGVAVTPDGKHAYVTNTADNNVSQYNIDAQTGDISPMSPATVPTGPDPLSI